MRQIILTLIAVVSFSPGLAQWLDAQEGSSAFAPTLSNKTSAPGKAPPGMVWIPGGEFSMGCNLSAEALCGLPGVTRDAQPIHRVHVDGFWMDATEVTNEEFEKFVTVAAK